MESQPQANSEHEGAFTLGFVKDKFGNGIAEEIAGNDFLVKILVDQICLVVNKLNSAVDPSFSIVPGDSKYQANLLIFNLIIIYSVWSVNDARKHPDRLFLSTKTMAMARRLAVSISK